MGGSSEGGVRSVWRARTAWLAGLLAVTACGVVTTCGRGTAAGHRDGVLVKFSPAAGGAWEGVAAEAGWTHGPVPPADPWAFTVSDPRVADAIDALPVSATVRFHLRRPGWGRSAVVWKAEDVTPRR